jgi:hypothetical protein
LAKQVKRAFQAQVPAVNPALWRYNVLLYCCRYHALTLTLLKAAWRRAQALVAARADAIMKVARELIDAEDEKIEGKRLVEIIEVREGVRGGAAGGRAGGISGGAFLLWLAFLRT